MKIAGIYLAAGKSSRMGSKKTALPVGTTTLGSLALETALQSPLDEVFVVISETDDTDWISQPLKSSRKCRLLRCPEAGEGQSASLQCGIREAQRCQADAAVILLADQPFITVKMIAGMIECLEKNPASRFIATSMEQTITPPVLFTASMFQQLLALTGDSGARALLHGDLLTQGRLLPCSDRRLVRDIDTKEQYEAMLKGLSEY